MLQVSSGALDGLGDVPRAEAKLRRHLLPERAYGRLVVGGEACASSRSICKHLGPGGVLTGAYDQAEFRAQRRKVYRRLRQ